MAAFINTNISSLNAQRNLNASQGALQTSLQRLSSGLRINSAKDDAAGLAVSQQMTNQIRSLNQATRNANDGISMVQTAEGAIGDMQNMLQRMKEVATQAANGAIDDDNRAFIAEEVDQIKQEMDNIANRTKFNGRSLLTGALSTSINTASSGIGVGLATGDASVTAIDVSGAKAGTTYTIQAYTAGDNALTMNDGNGNTQTVDITGGVAANGSKTLDFSSFGIKITLSSVAGETADNIGAAIDTLDIETNAAATSASVDLRVGADTNAENKITVEFSDMRLTGGTNFSALTTAINNFVGGGSSTQAEAEALMSAVDTALETFSSKRSDLGAVLNRLDNTISSNQTAVENLSASRSRIQDADFAAETAQMTRNQILQQAGTAMLAQANSLPNGVLALLRG